MKAILVLDMPKDCSECFCFDSIDDYSKQHYGGFLRFCIAADKEIGYVNFEDLRNEVQKPDWCPLKPTPDRIKHSIYDYDADTGYTCGWNDCLDSMIRE